MAKFVKVRTPNQERRWSALWKLKRDLSRAQTTFSVCVTNSHLNYVHLSGSEFLGMIQGRDPEAWMDEFTAESTVHWKKWKRLTQLVGNKTAKINMAFFKPMVQLHLQSCSQFWLSYLLKQLLEYRKWCRTGQVIEGLWGKAVSGHFRQEGDDQAGHKENTITVYTVMLVAENVDKGFPPPPLLTL